MVNFGGASWSKLYDQASASLGRLKRKCLTTVVENRRRERAALSGSKFFLKSPLTAVDFASARMAGKPELAKAQFSVARH